MFERFTIDRLAAAIDVEVKGAKPDSKLTRRFWCKGRRDGKRGRNSDAMRALITEAVRIASSKICEDYVASENVLLVEIARLESEIGVKSAGLGEEPALPEADPDSVNPSTLTAALGALEHRRALAEHQRATETRRADRSSINDLQVRKSTANKELAVLPVQVRQLVNSCEGVGKLFWARYCTGYVMGQSRSKASDGAAQVPSTEISFRCPCEAKLAGLAQDLAEPISADLGRPGGVS